MEVDFSKKQLVVAKHGLVVLTDGTGTWVRTGTNYMAFSGTVVHSDYISSGVQVGEWSNYFDATKFKLLDTSIFKNAGSK